MKLNKRKTVEILEARYINGPDSLVSIARDLGCSDRRLGQIGKTHIPDFGVVTRRKLREFASVRGEIFMLENGI